MALWNLADWVLFLLFAAIANLGVVFTYAVFTMAVHSWRTIIDSARSYSNYSVSTAAAAVWWWVGFAIYGVATFCIARVRLSVDSVTGVVSVIDPPTMSVGLWTAIIAVAFIHFYMRFSLPAGLTFNAPKWTIFHAVVLFVSSVALAVMAGFGSPSTSNTNVLVGFVLYIFLALYDAVIGFYTAYLCTNKKFVVALNTCVAVHGRAPVHATMWHSLDPRYKKFITARYRRRKMLPPVIAVQGFQTSDMPTGRVGPPKVAVSGSPFEDWN